MTKKNMSDHCEGMISNMMEAIKELNLVDFVLSFDDDLGFAFSLDERVSKIGNYPSVLEDGHSGCSFGITARACQKRLAEEPRQIKVINIENQDSEEVFEVEI